MALSWGQTNFKPLTKLDKVTDYNKDNKNKDASQSDKSAAPQEKRTVGKVQGKQTEGSRNESVLEKMRQRRFRSEKSLVLFSLEFKSHELNRRGRKCSCLFYFKLTYNLFFFLILYRRVYLWNLTLMSPITFVKNNLILLKDRRDRCSFYVHGLAHRPVFRNRVGAVPHDISSRGGESIPMDKR